MDRPELISTDQAMDNWISPSHACVFAAPNLVGGHEPADAGLDEGGGPNL